VRYADPYTTSLGDYDGRNWGGEFLGDKNSYMIVAPQYIRWGYGYGDLPAESVLYKGGRKENVYLLSHDLSGRAVTAFRE
jgi:hypothetical protein